MGPILRVWVPGVENPLGCQAAAVGLGKRLTIGEW